MCAQACAAPLLRLTSGRAELAVFTPGCSHDTTAILFGHFRRPCQRDLDCGTPPIEDPLEAAPQPSVEASAAVLRSLIARRTIAAVAARGVDTSTLERHLVWAAVASVLEQANLFHIILPPESTRPRPGTGHRHPSPSCIPLGRRTRANR